MTWLASQKHPRFGFFPFTRIGISQQKLSNLDSMGFVPLKLIKLLAVKMQPQGDHDSCRNTKQRHGGGCGSRYTWRTHQEVSATCIRQGLHMGQRRALGNA
jgi:hypothetical protein